MSEEIFWKIVLDVKFLAMKNNIRRSQLLFQYLSSLSAEQIVGFYLMMRSLIDRAGSNNIWIAAKILNNGYCSDDVFLYFRAWLISEGRGVYYAAISDPDSLADLDFGVDGDVCAEDEDFYFSAVDAYSQVTGMDIYEDPQVTSGCDDNIAPEFRVVGRVEDLFPRLWGRYGNQLNQRDFVFEPAGTVGSDEEITSGDSVLHKKYGEGFVESIMTGPPDVAFVKFGGDVRPIVLDSGCLEKMDKPKES